MGRRLSIVPDIGLMMMIADIIIVAVIKQMNVWEDPIKSISTAIGFAAVFMSMKIFGEK